MAKPKIVIVYYSMYGHILKLAETIAKSASSAGADVTILQVPETLPEEVLKKMHAPPKAAHKIATPEDLAAADGILFGIPTRFGMAAAQMKAFMDSTGSLWQKGALVGKPAGVFFSTGTQSGGQETTALTWITQLTHHGMIFVPLGYRAGEVQFDLTEVHGSSPYGAGTYAGADGSRQPSSMELKVAQVQGESFAKVVKKLK